MTPAERQADLEAAAEEEVERALSLGWRQLRDHTPWGDTFDGFTPGGQSVCFERTYLWDGEPGRSAIRVEVTVYWPDAYEEGVRVTRHIGQEPA